MKTNIKNLFTLLCGLALFACSDPGENEGTNLPENNKWSLGSVAGTRAVIGNEANGYRPIKWEEGDLLTVFDAEVDALFTLAGGQATSSGLFESSSDDLQNGTDYYAVHTNGLHQFAADKGVTVTYPAVKTVSGTIDAFVNDNMVLLSESFRFSDMSANGVALNNQVAVLEMPLKAETGENLSISAITLDAGIADFFVTSAVYDGAGAVDYTFSTTLKLNFATPVSLTDAAAVVVKFPVWMNPGITAADIAEKEFTLTFTGGSNVTIAELDKPAMLFAAGKYYSNTTVTTISAIVDNKITVKGTELVSGSAYAGYSSASVALVQNEVVVFKNFTDLEKQLYPAFFEYVSPTKAKFLGLDGTYELHLEEANGYILVDLKGNAPGIWMIWNATGFPNYGYNTEYKSAAGFGWNWNAPNRAMFFRKVSDDVFSGMVYCHSGSMSGYFVTRRDAPIPPNNSARQDYRLPLAYDNWTITTNVPNDDSTHPIVVETTPGNEIDRFRHRGTTNLGQYRWRVTITMSTKTVHFERLDD